MIYPSIGPARYKAPMEPGSIPPTITPRKSVAAHLPARDTFSTQTPLVVIGLAALGMIFLINSHAQPTPAREKVAMVVCSECGTVVAVRPAANAAAFVVEVQMLDGTLRKTEQPTRDFSVGDIVRVSGNVLTLKSHAS